MNKEEKQLKSLIFNYINREWVPSKNEEVIESVNPANTNEVVGTIQSSCEEDVI